MSINKKLCRRIFFYLLSVSFTQNRQMLCNWMNWWKLTPQYEYHPPAQSKLSVRGQGWLKWCSEKGSVVWVSEGGKDTYVSGSMVLLMVDTQLDSVWPAVKNRSDATTPPFHISTDCFYVIPLGAVIWLQKPNFQIHKFVRPTRAQRLQSSSTEVLSTCGPKLTSTWSNPVGMCP